MTAMPTVTRLAVAVAVAAGLAGCSKASDTPPSPRDAVLAAWKAEKLVPSGLATATVVFAKDCQAGTIENLDVLVCSFATPSEAKAAEPQGEAWIGQATGSSQTR